MDLDPKTIGRRITEIREEAGDSLSVLAEKAGIAKSYLLKLERGEVENPGLATLDQVAKALGRSLARLIEAEPTSVQNRRPASEWESLVRSAPPALLEFLEEAEHEGERIPTDTKVALAKVKFRGKTLKSKDDWRFIYLAIRRSFGTG